MFSRNVIEVVLPQYELGAGAAVSDLAAALPPSLVSRSAIEGLLSLAGRFPLTTGAAFDCSLDPDGKLGWSIRFRTEQERQWLATLEWKEEPWRRIRELGERWARHKDAGLLHNLWLTFDDGHSIPSVVADTGGCERARAADPWFLIGLLELLFGQRLRGEVLYCALACIDAAPAAGFLGSAGMTHGRDASLRFTIDGLSAADASRMIRHAELFAVLVSIAHLEPRVVLHFEAAAELVPIFGVEISPRSEKEWRPLLELLFAQIGRKAFVEPLMSCGGPLSLGQVKLLAGNGRPLTAKASFHYELSQD